MRRSADGEDTLTVQAGVEKKGGRVTPSESGDTISKNAIPWVTIDFPCLIVVLNKVLKLDLLDRAHLHLNTNRLLFAFVVLNRLQPKIKGALIH